jgi:ferredoxin
VLHCIRCGACLNICPVFRHVGGHTYGTTYPGPIGSVLTPHLNGIKEFKHLSFASSLCGACTSVCPVKIDLHHHLLQNRRNATEAGATKSSERMMFRIWRAAMGIRRFMRSAAGLCARRFASFTPWGSRARSSTQCGCGIVIARLCLCRPNRFERWRKEIGAFVKRKLKKVRIDNSSRDRILRADSRRIAHRVPEPAAMDSGRVIFEPVANPLERFQQECVSNLMECALTADRAASARQLSEVLQSLPEGEIFVQDDPSLRRLVEKTIELECCSGSSDSLVESGRARGSFTGDDHARRSSDCTDRVDSGERWVRRTRRLGDRSLSYCLCDDGQLVPDLTTALSRVSQERNARSQLVRVCHQRLQPHGRYRKNSGAGCARAATVGGHSAGKLSAETDECVRPYETVF